MNAPTPVELLDHLNDVVNPTRLAAGLPTIPPTEDAIIQMHHDHVAMRLAEQRAEVAATLPPTTELAA